MKPKLYKISAMVNYHVVVSAESKEAALASVALWEETWHSHADLVGVSDIAVVDVLDGTNDPPVHYVHGEH